jgi:hypothetical protein
MSLPSGQTVRCHITEDRYGKFYIAQREAGPGGLGPCNMVVGSSVDIVVPCVAQS